jgi:hypothetical protein
MNKESDLKILIRDAVNFNPGIKKKIEALRSGRLGRILQCYKESVDEYWPERNEYDKYVREHYLLKNVLFKPEKTKTTLKSWAKSDIWQYVMKKTGKRPDEYEFEIKFHQVLEDFRESEVKNEKYNTAYRVRRG